MEAEAAGRLRRVEHIVVLQLENRSFDHALGYLGDDQLRGWAWDPAQVELDTNVNGLTGATYACRGQQLHPQPLNEDIFDTHHLDPPHDAEEVAQQIAGAMGGFVDAWEAKLLGKAAGGRLVRLLRRLTFGLWKPGEVPRAKVEAVMSYATPSQVPMFDHLARHHCVCDTWFCSVAGPTMPNRFFSVAGTHNGEMRNVKLLLNTFGKPKPGKNFRSLFQDLGAHDWRWYSSDPAVLRAIDQRYRLDKKHFDNFAYFSRSSEVQPDTFLGDLLTGRLRKVSWIDPNFAVPRFVEEVVGGVGSNDDHPPTRLIDAQRLVHRLYTALGESHYWDTTMVIVTYDEHGGFYDHVEPPARPKGPSMGPRIPALVFGGPVKRGVYKGRAPDKPLDHASVIKTVLRRFGRPGWADQNWNEDVLEACDLSDLVRDDDRVSPYVPVSPAIVGQDVVIVEPQPLEEGASRRKRARQVANFDELTDLQRLIVRYHALPLRTGRETVGVLPAKTARWVAAALPNRHEDKRLPERRP